MPRKRSQSERHLDGRGERLWVEGGTFRREDANFEKSLLQGGALDALNLIHRQINQFITVNQSGSSLLNVISSLDLVFNHTLETCVVSFNNRSRRACSASSRLPAWAHLVGA